MKQGTSVVEILVASIIMATIVIPLLTLFQSGVETTKATIKEVQGANLAAELSEQLDTIPFQSLMKLCSTGNVRFSSTDGSLKDYGAIDAEEGYFFHVSPPPDGFSRDVEFTVIDSGKILAVTRVTWPVNKKRDRTISINRMICRAQIGAVQ